MDNEKIVGTAKLMAEAIERTYDVKLTDHAKAKLLMYARKYSRGECFDATIIALEHYDDPVDALFKIGGILYNRAAMRKMYIETEDNGDEVHN